MALRGLGDVATWVLHDWAHVVILIGEIPLPLPPPSPIFNPPLPLPCSRFKLEYITEEQQYEKPVIVHRAILGSVERMFAILTEHFAGSWPLWISPRQVMVVPVSEKQVRGVGIAFASWNQESEEVKSANPC